MELVRYAKVRKLVMQRGDTIVEVLIAIAVASLVLAITYSTMNRNLQISRDSQERTEATKIAQGQIELLKAYKDISTPGLDTGTYCLDTTPPKVHGGFPGGTPTATLPDDFTKYGAGTFCKNLGISKIYNVAITANSGIYKVYVRWDNIQGTASQDQIILVYKL